MKRWAPLLLGLLIVAVVVYSRRGGTCTVSSREFDAALAQAELEDKPLLLLFTGSDWCDWCIKFEREISSAPEFKDYARDHLVVMTVDFPRRQTGSDELSRQREELARCYGVRGFPTVFLLNSNGKPMARTGYQPGGGEAYVAHIKKLIADGQ